MSSTHTLSPIAISEVTHDAETISDVLDRICATGACEPDGSDAIRFGDALDRVGRRAYGPLLLLVGLFSISPITVIPGMTWLAATITLAIAGQMLAGRANPWLPRSALNARLPRKLLVRGVAAARPLAGKIDLLLKPRLLVLSRPPAIFAIAALTGVAALITYPLGFVPAGAVAPGIAVALFGLGMSARDGAVLILGALFVLVAAALFMALAGGTAALAVITLLAWF